MKDEKVVEVRSGGQQGWHLDWGFLGSVDAEGLPSPASDNGVSQPWDKPRVGITFCPLLVSWDSHPIGEVLCAPRGQGNAGPLMQAPAPQICMGCPMGCAPKRTGYWEGGAPTSVLTPFLLSERHSLSSSLPTPGVSVTLIGGTHLLANRIRK
jgi:hypothetical protein